MKPGGRKTGRKRANGKNPHAAALGRLGGLKGGRARAAALTPQERRTIATKAAQAVLVRRTVQGFIFHLAPVQVLRLLVFLITAGFEQKYRQAPSRQCKRQRDACSAATNYADVGLEARAVRHLAGIIDHCCARALSAEGLPSWPEEPKYFLCTAATLAKKLRSENCCW